MSWSSIDPEIKQQKPRLLVAAQDPGGANAIAPVAKRFLEDGIVDLVVVGAQWAGPVLRSQGLATIALPELIDKGIRSWVLLEACARSILADHPIQALLVGTSWGPSIEKALTRLARLQGIPSVAVLDAWTNYVERFSGSLDDERWAYLPDRVAIMDGFARDEMRALGFPEDRLVVTGQPAFDELLHLAAQMDASQFKQELLSQLGMPADALLVLFISQSVSAIYGNDQSSSRHIGYDEHSVLRDVVTTIEASQPTYQRPLALAVKAHPKEDPVELEGTLRSAGSVAPVLTDEDPRKLLLIADVVIGMSSMLLVESYLLGKPTISYQPGLRGDDPLILTRAGILKRVDGFMQLRSILHAALSGGLQSTPEPESWRPLGGATERVVTQVYGMLGI